MKRFPPFLSGLPAKGAIVGLAVLLTLTLTGIRILGRRPSIKRATLAAGSAATRSSTALAIEPSGLSSGMGRFETMPPTIPAAMNLDPINCAKADKILDPELLAWLEDWETIHCEGKSISQPERRRLQMILGRGKNNCHTLFQIAKGFQLLSQDERTTVLFYGAIADDVEQQVSDASRPLEQRISIINDLYAFLPDYKTVIWKNIEGYGAFQYATVLEALYSCLLKHILPGDPRFAKVAQVQIGVIECLHLEG
jgi:hypothetical protein